MTNLYQAVCDDCGAISPAYQTPQGLSNASRHHVCARACLHCRWRQGDPVLRGLCRACHLSAARYDYPLLQIHRRGDLVEDAEWLIEDGANLTQALARLGVKNDALWKACQRAGRGDVYDRLADREPNGEFRAKMRAIHRARRAS